MVVCYSIPATPPERWRFSAGKEEGLQVLCHGETVANGQADQPLGNCGALVLSGGHLTPPLNPPPWGGRGACPHPRVTARGPVTWAKIHGKYQVPKAPKKNFLLVVLNCCSFSAIILWCNPPPHRGERSRHLEGGI